MRSGKFPIPGHATVVAYAALVVALGGSVAAASGLIDGASIKAHTIPGTALRNHAVAETQLNLGQLPDVPNAATPFAPNYVHNTALIRLSGGQSRVLFNHAPWRVTATCQSVSPGVWEAHTFVRNTGHVAAQVLSEYSGYQGPGINAMPGASVQVGYDATENTAGTGYGFDGGYNDFSAATLTGKSYLLGSGTIGANVFGAPCAWDLTFGG